MPLIANSNLTITAMPIVLLLTFTATPIVITIYKVKYYSLKYNPITSTILLLKLISSVLICL